MEVKALGSTRELLSKLSYLNSVEVGRIPSVEVKFVDIGKNTGGEGGDLVHLLTLRRESVGSKQD